MAIEFWSLLFSALTFLVIAVTAIAAIVQLRHLRASNQLSALLTILEDWQRPEMQSLVRYVRSGELSEKLKDPAYLQSIGATMLDTTLHPWVHICDYFEQLGSYVRHGLVDKAPYLDVSCIYVCKLYELIEPCIEKVRQSSGNDAIYDNFEYLAVQSVLWMESHPSAYPARVPHFKDLKR